MKKISALKGMKDLLNEDARLYEKIIQTCETVARAYGFDFLATPHLEFTHLFRRTVGESSDIVGKEMYEFIDKGGNEICLRPEGTAGAVRVYVEAGFAPSSVAKNGTLKRFFYHGAMFRYERPQRGRFREFHQFGVESFGEKNVLEDASLILMLAEIFARLKIKFKLAINSLGCETCMAKYRVALLEFLASQNELCQDCIRRKNINALRVLDCKNEACQKYLKDAPVLSSFLCEDCAGDFEILQRALRENGLDFFIDDRLVRGLDYYSKTAFEFLSDELGAKSAIAGGGRYDKLVDLLSNQEKNSSQAPSGAGVGFALGIERIIELLKLQKNEPASEGIYLCALDKNYLTFLLKIATTLRKNHRTILNYESKKLAKHLELAARGNFDLFLCMGQREAEAGELFFKKLITRQEGVVKISELNKWILDNFGAATRVFGLENSHPDLVE